MKIHIVAKGNYFAYYGNALARKFEQLGHHVVLATRDSWEIDCLDADIHIIVSPNVYARADVQALPGYKIGILTEQMPHNGGIYSDWAWNRYTAFKEYHHDYDEVVEWSRANYEWITKNHPGVVVTHFTHGWIDRPYSVHDIKWDVCFVGDVSRSPRRRVILQRLKDARINVCPYHEGLWGEEKDEVFGASRIVLNLHFSDAPRSFEAHRFFDVATQRRPMVSEPVNEPYDTLRGTVPQVDADGMADTIRWMLEEDQVYLDIQYGQALYGNLRNFQLGRLAKQLCTGH